jgi:phosphatidylglycerophosphatase A
MEYYNPHFLFCTFFGIGKISKKISGTLGSLAALPTAYLIKMLSVFILRLTHYENFLIWYCAPIIITMLLFVIAIYSSGCYSKAIKAEDPKEVVIDEVLGQMLCLFVTLPITFIVLYNRLPLEKLYYDLIFLLSIIGNFILFRAFDILKPWPINYIDQKIKGGLGIMLDDFLAAIFAIIVYFAGLMAILDYYA